MAKKIFKVGDRVFDAMCGWGEVKDIDRHLVFVKFDKDDNIDEYYDDGRFCKSDTNPRLSFTEYGFDNRFSQKRVFDYKNYIGKWGKFWDDRIKEYIISRLERITSDGFESNTSIRIYNNFEPLTEEQIKMLNLK